MKYTAKDKEFWDFDNNDFATDDLDHFMKYVGEFTNQKIDIVTISLGIIIIIIIIFLVVLF